MSQQKFHMELDETVNKLLTEGVESKGLEKEQAQYLEIISTLVLWLSFVLKSGAIISCWGQSRREWRLTKASLCSVLPSHTSHFASKLILNEYLRTVNLKDHHTIALLWAPNHWSSGGSSLSPDSSDYPASNSTTTLTSSLFDNSFPDSHPAHCYLFLLLFIICNLIRP